MDRNNRLRLSKEKGRGVEIREVVRRKFNRQDDRVLSEKLETVC